ncbi:DUF2306 domain-containing protein [Ulvibacterium marinum]|uniref:DUF2306 domain-containing protein n=1 Tax=Ulvibacterium marinum TaxID=2419782 RepID=UPI0024947430|nr:DUF2306 domain-containing protein [Ulvibacterium marinum]
MNSKHHSISISQRKTIFSNKALSSAAAIWFVTAVLGQWIFAFYVAAFYGGAAINGDFMKWNRVLPHGYIEGDTIGNTAVAIHLLFAIVIMLGGPIQFVPQIRNRFPAFHRWNGKLYLVTAFIASFSGIYMVLTKGTITGITGDISVSFNGLLIMLFALLAWRMAVVRKFKAHERWVLRLFLVVNGVWFFRIGLMLSFLLNGGPFGFDPETFRGPFITFLGIGQYMIPLLILELYFFTKDRTGNFGKLAMATTLFVMTIFMGLGVFAATTGMWLPRL